MKNAPWIICPCCRGEGKSSAYLGSYSREEFEREFDYEEQEAYFNGDYDRTCDTCHGSGKVRDEPFDPAWESERRMREAEAGWR
jgi:hypothetical protein